MRGTAAQHDKFVRMTTEPVGKLVTELAVPSIVSMLVTALYNIADTFFVGRLNTQSVAALGIVFAYMTLIQAISRELTQARMMLYWQFREHDSTNLKRASTV